MLLRKSVDSTILKMIEKITKQLDGFYKDYDAPTDEALTAAMLELYGRNAGAELTPPELGVLIQKYGANYPNLSRYLFTNSVFDNGDQLKALLGNFRKGSEKKIMNDPAYALSLAVTQYYQDVILPPHSRINDRINLLQRRFMQAQMMAFPEKKFFPDANLTLRVSYGKVSGFEARDAVQLDYFTTLDGVAEKFTPGDEFYDAPQKLMSLYHQKSFGRYADPDGTLHTCFITSAHTTGGSSGSPVLDATGNLTGLNFDRCQEATMGDYAYEETQFRNIAVDIRYALFITDTYAGAGYLLDEMKLVD